jgi:SAM-dependent MidA family methyltransferase
VSPEASLAERLARLIETHGPITVARYMAEANAHYYATRDPLGATGDFTTSPEISQMFGEMIGAWAADLWTRAGAPADAVYVELGPGRGTLASDALRAMRPAGFQPPVHFVETSPALRAQQVARVPHVVWHEDVASLPSGAPLIVVANEFFDALPVRQLVAGPQGWSERLVAHRKGRFVPLPGPLMGAEAIPARLRDAPPGTVLESSPASLAILRQLADRIAASGGAALIVDYGHVRTSAGDTLQAVSKHAFADPWVAPGERDLTAHVDFEALAEVARGAGLHIFGPRPQGEWLEAIGIGHRARALAESQRGRSEEIAAAHSRLTAPGEMGKLFKAMALAVPAWPMPAGFS